MNKYNNSLHLDKYGLQNLSQEENEDTNGGFIVFALGLLAAGVGYIAKRSIDDWQCFKDGLAGKPCTHDSSHKE